MLRDSAPNWSKIFALRPDLESPGYQETVASMKEKLIDYEHERLVEKIKQIHKEKQSQKNKNRAKLSAKPSGDNSGLGRDQLTTFAKRKRS